MSAVKLRTVENLILLTFPLVVFAGCAGSDVKPANQEPVQLGVYQSQLLENNDQTKNSDLSTVSLANENSGNQYTTKTTEEAPAAKIEKESTEEKRAIASNTPPIPENMLFFFDTNTYILSQKQREELNSHANFLKSNPGSILVINGHADERGTEEYNQQLSENRAREIFTLLVNSGVPKDQLLMKGFGELVPMHSESNWDENRRVELEYTNSMMLSSM